MARRIELEEADGDAKM